MAEPSDDLTRAIDLSIEFELQDGEKDVEAFLQKHESLRRILEPLLTEDDEADKRQTLGDFELVRELGRGGMGVVYEAIQTLLGRTVALKLLPPHRALSPRSLAMFRREATLAASLDHPGIAKVLEFQEIEGQLVLAMEMIDGRPLEDIVEDLRESKLGPLTARDINSAFDVTRDGDSTWGDSYEAAAVEIARQVADALAHAHSRGVVHRDVKPGNILITPDGAAVLTDFGLAREEGMRGVTNSGEFAGTYRYSAPEQLEGRSAEIAGRTDVYALGATLYELLTLRTPIEADSVTEMIVRMRQEDPAQPSKLNSRVNSDLDAVVLCALEKEPNRRYASAEELATDLAHVLDRTPVKARRLSVAGRASRWVRRNRLVSVFVIFLMASTAIISVLATNTAAAEREAKKSVSRYENLAVGTILTSLRSRAAKAHPPWPAQTESLRELVAIGDRLLAQRADQLAALEELRAGMSRDEPRASSRPPHPASDRVAELGGWIQQLTIEMAAAGVTESALEQARGEVRQMREEVAELRASIVASDRVHIDDVKQSSLHDRIEDQLFQLRELENTFLPDLRFRLSWSESVAAKSVTTHATSWRSAADRAKSDGSKYGATLRENPLVPQIGLVPLGPDPDSGLEEFAHLLSGAVPKRGEGRLQLTESSGVVFVLVPGGTLRSSLPPKGTEVELAPFLIAKHELSRAQWERLARSLPGLRWRDGGVADVRNAGEMNKPVNGVSWLMCDRLFDRCGLELPTSAQWEYAAEAGGGLPATWEAAARIANVLDEAYVKGRRSDEPHVPFHDGYIGLAPIHSMHSDSLGLHHMLGNVAEWCRDLSTSLGTPPRSGDGARDVKAGRFAIRVLCGGHFKDKMMMRMWDKMVATAATRTAGVRPTRRLVRETH